MCIAVPCRIVNIDGPRAMIEIGGVRREIFLDLVDDVSIGDYVIVHAGYAIQRLDTHEAEETLRLFREMINEIP